MPPPSLETKDEKNDESSKAEDPSSQANLDGSADNVSDKEERIKDTSTEIPELEVNGDKTTGNGDTAAASKEVTGTNDSTEAGNGATDKALGAAQSGHPNGEAVNGIIKNKTPAEIGNPNGQGNKDSAALTDDNDDDAASEDVLNDLEQEEDEEEEEEEENKEMDHSKRYELIHWPYHLREAEDLWSAEEKEHDATWQELWDLVIDFLSDTSGALREWQVEYRVLPESSRVADRMGEI